ncbi:MAG: TRAM domain-containing protein, partial [Propionicimonas sp.]
MLEPGQLTGPVEVGPVAHGGHCVARVDGVVVFVRHAIPGELVTLRVTEVQSKFARADVAEVLEASPARRRPPCPVAGECGGCDFQHLAAPDSRELKRRVVAELLEHHAGIRFDGEVEGFDDGFGWRTRMRYQRTADGGLGLRRHRSEEVVPLPPEGCRIAADAIARPGRAPA